MSDNGYRCGHAACECTVPTGGGFCSTWCEEHASSSDGRRCECGHEACEYRMNAEGR